MITLLEATTDRNLFAPWFRKRETWTSWFAFLAALFGAKMTDEQTAIYKACTGLSKPRSPVE